MTIHPYYVGMARVVGARTRKGTQQQIFAKSIDIRHRNLGDFDKVLQDNKGRWSWQQRLETKDTRGYLLGNLGPKRHHKQLFDDLDDLSES